MFTSIYNFFYPPNDIRNAISINDVIVKPEPKLLVSISKDQINTDSFFLPFMEKHNLVRHWVIFNDCGEKSIYGYPSWYGHSQKISTEMIALGCKNRIDQLFETLLNKNEKLPQLILIQTTGYYPLGIFTNVDFESSRPLVVEEAKEFIKNIDYISIANID